MDPEAAKQHSADRYTVTMENAVNPDHVDEQIQKMMVQVAKGFLGKLVSGAEVSATDLEAAQLAGLFLQKLPQRQLV